MFKLFTTIVIVVIIILAIGMFIRWFGNALNDNGYDYDADNR